MLSYDKDFGFRGHSYEKKVKALFSRSSNHHKYKLSNQASVEEARFGRQGCSMVDRDF